MNIEGNIARTTVSDAVFRRLRDQILGSEATVGAPLPSERTLSDTFGVNRHAVREAIKRLQQAGLVTVVHGGATRVTDWRTQCGPELLGALAAGLDADQRAALADQIVTARCAILETLAAHAAANGARGEGLRAAAADAGAPGSVEGYRGMWDAIAGAAANLAAQLTLNSLSAGLDALGDEGAAVFAEEASRTSQIDALVAAVDAGDSDAARAAARSLLASDADISLAA